MPRCLVMAEREVAESDRAGYLQSLAVRRERAAAASANFWVFEDPKSPGRFLEFVEAGSEGALARALDEAGRASSTPSATPVRQVAMQVVWQEVTDVS